MTSAHTHKFYEPIVLLEALNDGPGHPVAVRSTARPAIDSPDLDDPANLFRAFVYKLAHVCDSVKGKLGTTITSFMVLRSERTETADDIVHYYFASNRRSERELEITRAYIHALLRKVNLAPEDADPYKSNMLRDIIAFNRQRLLFYLNRLKDSTIKCQLQIQDLFPADALNAGADLGRIMRVLNTSHLWADTQSVDATFAYSYERLMRRLTTFEMSTTGKGVAEHVREYYSEIPLDENCWYQFQHVMSRILAYPKSLACMLKTRQKWPVLFEQFYVFAVPSSQLQNSIIGRKKSYTAKDIVGRMTRRATDITAFRDYVQELQMFDLDSRIVATFSDKDFKPIVHSEVLLLNFLEFSDGGISPARFWGGLKERMYIGSSKPLCRLCKYYFEEHASGVGHRVSHDNLYKHWRFPDVLVSQGRSAIIRREQMLDKVLKRIRADAFQLIRNRVGPRGSYNDSNTWSANVTLRDNLSTVAGSDIDEITSMIGGASLNDDYETGDTLDAGNYSFSGSLHTDKQSEDGARIRPRGAADGNSVPTIRAMMARQRSTTTGSTRTVLD